MAYTVQDLARHQLAYTTHLSPPYSTTTSSTPRCHPTRRLKLPPPTMGSIQQDLPTYRGPSNTYRTVGPYVTSRNTNMDPPRKEGSQ